MHLTDDLRVLETGEPLRMVPSHTIGIDHVRYHRGLGPNLASLRSDQISEVITVLGSSAAAGLGSEGRRGGNGRESLHSKSTRRGEPT